MDSGSEGDIAVRHFSEEGDFFFRPVVPGFGFAGVATDAARDPLFMNGEDVHAVGSGDFAVGNLAKQGDDGRGPVDGLGRTRCGDAECLALFENSADTYVEFSGEGGIWNRSEHGDLPAGPEVSNSVF